jgi:hypothetical protein
MGYTGESCASACARSANCTGAVYVSSEGLELQQGGCYLMYGVLGGEGCDGEESDGLDTYRMLPPGSCPGGTHQNESACVAGECSAG